MADSQSQQSSSNELIYRAVVLAVAGLMALGIVRLRFCSPLTLPAKPPKPEATEASLQQVTKSVGANPVAYAGYLEQDSRRYQVVPGATPEQMGRVFPYRLDETRYTLNPGKKSDSVEVAGLRLSASVRKIRGSPRKMMVLNIENLGDKHLAYRIVTKPDPGTKACHSKPSLLHNAMAIAPGGREERSECLYRRRWKLRITRVETVELPPLAYHYVSRLRPELVGIDSRVSEGHSPPEGSPCNMVMPASVRNAVDSGRVTWRDLIDFFARHRCDTYRFPENYKAFSEDGQLPLPVMAPR